MKGTFAGWQLSVIGLTFNRTNNVRAICKPKYTKNINTEPATLVRWQRCKNVEIWWSCCRPKYVIADVADLWIASSQLKAKVLGAWTVIGCRQRRRCGMVAVQTEVVAVVKVATVELMWWPK